MKKQLFLIMFCLFLSSQIVAQKTDLGEQIETNAVTISNTDPRSALIETERLNEIFREVQIFGFGEATHGTKEFAQIKFKFLKYLVQEQGLKNVAIEASYGNCLAINQYIKGKEGDARELLKKLEYWIWNTDEMLEVIEWMRNYNLEKEPSAQINFYGIDITDPTYSATSLKDYLEGEKLEENTELIKVLEIYSSKNKAGNLKKRTYKKHFAILERLKAAFLSSEDCGSPFLNRLTTSVLQYIALQIDMSQEIRDREMFENIKWISDSNGENSKVFIWSMNFHVKKNTVTFTNDLSMGYHLKENFGDKYYSLGFDFGSGNFNAVNTKKRKIEEFSISAPMKNSSTEVFDSSPIDIFLLDFNGIEEKSQLNDFIHRKVFYRAIGSNYSPKMIEKERLNEAYDGIIFVRKTEASSLRK